LHQRIHLKAMEGKHILTVRLCHHYSISSKLNNPFEKTDSFSAVRLWDGNGCDYTRTATEFLELSSSRRYAKCLYSASDTTIYSICLPYLLFRAQREALIRYNISQDPLPK
jgi:hypothetical protein